MKCSSPFILAYNRLFHFLNEKGYDELEDFWALLEDAVLGRLRYLAETEGLVGLTKYWSETLTAEGADFCITYNNGNMRSVTIHIRECPSLAKIKAARETVCEQYCGHCKVMYQRALSPRFHFDIITADVGCLIRIEE
jgi:hypothetical protein